jgi:HEAT repeat protein
MRCSLALLLLVVIVTALGAAPAPARADEALDPLLLEWEMVCRRHDERGYAEQRDLLDRIAALRSPRAQEGLAKLLTRPQTMRQQELILTALFRHATTGRIEGLLRAAEQDQNEWLLLALPSAVAAVASVPTREFLWGTALRRAPPAVKIRLIEGLGRLGDADAVPPLLMLLRHANLDVRVAVLEAVGRLSDARAVGPVAVYLQDEDWRVREAAARALGATSDARTTRALVRALRDENPRVVESAAGALGAVRDRDAIEDLIACLERVAETDLRVADTVANALQAITGRAFGVVPEGWREWWNTAKQTDWKRLSTPANPHTVPARRYYGFPIRSSKLVFVLDISRSMGWNGRLDRAKDELARVFREMPSTTRFNIVTYSDGAEMWKPSLREATPTTVASAIKYVERQKPDNGTNTYEALMVAMSDPDADTIYFLSDGHPSIGLSDPDLILAALRKENRHRNVHVHCVALIIGEPPIGYAGREDRTRATSFMERLAAENGGEFQKVE